MTEPAIATSDQKPTKAKPPTPRTDEKFEARPYAPAAAPTGGWLAFAALAWMLVALLAGRRSLTGGSGDFDLVLAAAMLPALVQASMVAGAAVGLSGVALLTLRGWDLDRRGKRVSVGLGGGLLVGLVASGAVMIAFGVPASAAALMASAVGVSGGLGGLLSTIGPRRFVPAAIAGVSSALAVISISYGVNILIGRTELLAVFGADGTPERDFAANGLLAGTLALTTGLLAGLLAYWRLRRATRRNGQPLPWPAYAIAGASAGLMLIISELFIRLGAPRLLAMASVDVTADQVAQSMAADSRLNTGIVVAFVGAICAIIAIGRTMRHKVG